MPLELRKQKDGSSLRPFWYGRFETNGKRQCITLCRIEGTPPASGSLQDAGDRAFERSRQRATELLAAKVQQAKDQREAQHWVSRLHEIQHGEKIKEFPIENLLQAWERMPKKKTLAELHPRYLTVLHATLRRFIEFIQAKYPKVKDAGQVTSAIAGDFMADEEARGISAKTRNDSLKRLRAVFRQLHNEELVARNPFANIQLHTENHVHRRPLTPQEVEQVLEAVKGDDFVRPLIRCALSTAMRLGDCCRLRWSDARLDGKDARGQPTLDFITVKTSKTGETVTAPVDAALKAELLTASPPQAGDGKRRDHFVWPEQAEMYHKNQSGVTWRVRQAFARAGLGDDETHVDRKRGMRRASVVDFHSLRTTWITEKLADGVPIEAIQRTSGHRTADVVREHYNRPGEQQHLMTLMGRPGAGLSRDQLLAIVVGMTAKTLKQDKARLVAMLEGGVA